MVYLDWAATAIPQNKIIEDSLKKSLTIFGNPSSAHRLGIEAKELLDECRNRCSDILHCKSENLYFTSCATEANNIAVLSFLKKHLSGEIITTSLEHPSNMEPVNILKNFGWKVKLLNPASNGIIPIKKIIKSINDKTKLISLIYVHNETGVIQPIDEIVEAIREKEIETGKKIHIHIDAVQAAGKVEINPEKQNIDSFSISGHKFGAPKGVGLLYLKKDRDVIYRGGGQEGGIRPGTQDLFGILSLTECLIAADSSRENEAKRLKTLMGLLISGVREIGIDTIPKSREIEDQNFVPNILSLTSTPLPGEVIARVLSEKGFMISTGSACSSNKKSNTSGLLSMGITKDEGFSSFRVSIGRTTTESDIEAFLVTLKDTIEELSI